jgi:hypothetical protein
MLFRRSLFSSLLALALALALALVFALAPASVLFADSLDTSSRDWDRDGQTAQPLADRDDRSLTDHLVFAALGGPAALIIPAPAPRARIASDSIPRVHPTAAVPLEPVLVSAYF